MAKYKISFIGSGNVATNLAHALDLAGHTINQVISRSEESAKELASKYGAYYSDDISMMYKDADFIIISVPDDEYDRITAKLPTGMKSIICHTAGGVPMEVLDSYASDYGVIYPLQSFRKEKIVSMLDVPVFIEYNSKKAEFEVQELAKDISNTVIEATSEEREKYHLAAVFANNFTNLMYDLSDKYLVEEGLNFKYLLPIIQETAHRIKNDKPYRWQTGPAVRGDKKVIAKHLQMLQNSETKEIYQLLTNFLMTEQ